eukprot:6354817-Amphidinium_carterae.1
MIRALKPSLLLAIGSSKSIPEHAPCCYAQVTLSDQVKHMTREELVWKCKQNGIEVPSISEGME